MNNCSQFVQCAPKMLEVHNVSTQPEEDRATSIGRPSMHKNLAKIGCEVPDIYSRTDRQTLITILRPPHRQSN